MPPRSIRVYGTVLQPAAITAAFVRDNLRRVFEFWQAHGLDAEHGGFRIISDCQTLGGKLLNMTGNLAGMK